MKIPANAINISDEMNKSGVWKHVNSENDLRANVNGKTAVINDKNKQVFFFFFHLFVFINLIMAKNSIDDSFLPFFSFK